MVRVGIVGTSWWADGMYLPALKNHPQAEVRCVCGRDYGRLQEFAKRWDIPCTYTDWREMIYSGEIDALIVASTDETHYPISMMALDAGLHVLCDKPLAITADQAHEMARKANDKRAITMVPFTYRYMPTTRYCKQLIDDGFIGKPLHMNMRYYTGFARKGEYDWRFDVSIAGSGVVGNLGVHWLHLARWLYGEIVGLSCYLDTLVKRPNRPDGSDYVRADDSAVLTVKFASGAYGVLEMIAACYEGTSFGQTHHMEFHGSEGTLYNTIDWDTVQQVKGVKVDGKPEQLDVPESIWQGARRDTVHNTYRDIFREQDNMTRAFITAVANKQPTFPDFNEGARVQSIVEAAIKSAHSGCCWVEVLKAPLTPTPLPQGERGLFPGKCDNRLLMLPIRLEIKNFLAYRSPDPVYFEGIHLACITGPNGAGKSSLLDAITWALWGEARTRRAEDLIHQGQTDMHVQLDFEQEDVLYRVVRRRTRRGGSAGTLDLFVLKDGQPKTINEGNMRATQTKIDGILRMDYDTFVHSAFLQQGKADAFTTKPPAERKKILADILGLARWEAYEERVKETLKAIEKDLAQIDAILHQIDTELAQEPGLRAQLVEAERQQQEAQGALDAAEARLQEVAHAPGELRAAQERKAALEVQRRSHEKDLSATETEVKFQQKRIAEYQAVIDARADIEAGYAALQTARETNTALGDKLRQLNTIIARRTAVEQQIQAARAEIEGETRGHMATIVQLQRTLDAAHPDELSELGAELLSLEALEQQRDDVQDALVNLEKEQAELKATNKALYAEMNAIKERQNRLGEVEGATVPLCGQPLDEAHRLQLVEELQAEGTTRGDTYRANEARVKAITSELKHNKEAAAAIADELKRLGTLKERAAALQAGVDAAHEAAQRMDEARAQLDLLQQMLDSDDFAHELRAQLAEIEAEGTALGYDDSLHDAARAQLDTYREYESRQKDLEIALKSLPDVQARLKSVLANRERLLMALADDRAALEANAAEIGQLEALVREYHQREGEVKIQRTNERTAYGRLVDARQALDALERQRERKAQKEAQRVEKRAEQALYDELKLAFGKNGIPAMIIETAIPELEVSANHLLSRMTDGRMHLAMRTQKEKITGGVAETLEIDIADELGTRAYEMYSGGEAFRINFAIRVALSQLLARRAGAHLRTLFLDEGFGTQDEDGRNKLVEAITAVQDDFAMILVITHIDDLRDSFPVHILLEKTGDRESRERKDDGMVSWVANCA